MTDDRPKRIDLTDTTKEHGRTLVHLLGYHGDGGENESVLSVTADLSSGDAFPETGRIFVGTPQKSPLLEGYFPDLGAWACSPDAADRLAAELGGASAMVRAAMVAPEQGDAARIPALWFTSKGGGPDEMFLELEPLKELRDGSDLVAPATLGLRVRAGELVILGAALIDGGFQFAREQVEQLHRGLGAWLARNPPRGDRGDRGAL